MNDHCSCPWRTSEYRTLTLNEITLKNAPHWEKARQAVEEIESVANLVLLHSDEPYQTLPISLDNYEALVRKLQKDTQVLLDQVAKLDATVKVIRENNKG